MSSTDFCVTNHEGLGSSWHFVWRDRERIKKDQKIFTFIHCRPYHKSLVCSCSFLRKFISFLLTFCEYMSSSLFNTNEGSCNMILTFLPKYYTKPHDSKWHHTTLHDVPGFFRALCCYKRLSCSVVNCGLVWYIEISGTSLSKYHTTLDDTTPCSRVAYIVLCVAFKGNKWCHVVFCGI